MKWFNTLSASKEECEATMMSELRNMVRAEIQVEERETGASIPKPTFWANELEVLAMCGMPAIGMAFRGRYGVVCLCCGLRGHGQFYERK